MYDRKTTAKILVIYLVLQKPEFTIIIIIKCVMRKFHKNVKMRTDNNNLTTEKKKINFLFKI